ncbi:Cytochrome P450 71A21 [Bienertia sinuspersici]
MASYYIRSLSFPSKPHPIVKQFDEQLSRLRSSQSASTSSSSLTQTLTNLNDLYCSVDQLLQLPLNQKAMSQNVQSNSIEEVLDGSLRLLDICGTSRDLLVQSKECLQSIQSSLRRRCNGELDITNEAVQYLNTRKSAKKLIKKALKNIKDTEQTNEENVVKSMLKDVEGITQDILKSVLSYIGGAKFESGKSKWSLISKLVHHGGDKEAMASTSEFDLVDASFESIICLKTKGGINMSQMVKLETEIQDLVEGLDVMFRHLVKTRSSLLNILMDDQNKPFTNEIVQYQKTRKIIRKIIKRCLKDIKEVEKTNEANATESLLNDV